MGDPERIKNPGGVPPRPDEDRERLRAVRGAPGRIDEVIHQKTRLAIMSALAAVPSMSFNELKALLETSDGNVSVHTRKLEDAGFLRIRKGFVDRTPHTEYEITPAGREALADYVAHLERLIAAARRGEE